MARKRTLSAKVIPAIFLLCLLASSEDYIASATQEITLAKQSEEQSYSQALSHYQKALDMLEKAVNDPANPDLAKNLKTGQIKNQDLNYSQLKEEVIPKIREYSQAESDILNCALLLSDQGYSLGYISIARSLKAEGRSLEAKETMIKAFNAAQKAIPEYGGETDNAKYIIDSLLEFGMADSAKALANQQTDKNLQAAMIQEIKNFNAGANWMQRLQEELPSCSSPSPWPPLAIVNSEKDLAAARQIISPIAKAEALAKIGEFYLRKNDPIQAKNIYLEAIAALAKAENYVDDIGDITSSYYNNGGKDGEVYARLAELAGLAFSGGISAYEGAPLDGAISAYACANGKDRKVLLRMIGAVRKICPADNFHKSSSLNLIADAYRRAGLKSGPEEIKILHQIVYDNAHLAN